jgi:hypothetical protein
MLSVWLNVIVLASQSIAPVTSFAVSDAVQLKTPTALIVKPKGPVKVKVVASTLNPYGSPFIVTVAVGVQLWNAVPFGDGRLPVPSLMMIPVNVPAHVMLMNGLLSVAAGVLPPKVPS